MIINNFKPFIGQHCETTATGSLLQHLGIDLSEPMLFGLGEGLGFIFWHMKSMGMPFLGGRIKNNVLTENLCKNLNLKLESKETSSIKIAWENVKESIDGDRPVGLQLDCYYLDYFTNKFHFAGHVVAMYGYDDNYVYLVDTEPQGSRAKTSLKNLELARNAKGAMASKNLSYTIQKTSSNYDLAEAIITAVKNNAEDYLHPPIKNIGYKGILKTSEEIKKWFKNTEDIEGDFKTIAMLMEKAGTGGAMFRNLYRDFLKESFDTVKADGIRRAHDMFREIADLWSEVSALFNKAGDTQDIGHINRASDILVDLSERERMAMKLLAGVSLPN